MKWLRAIAERYEKWRLRTERELVAEVLKIQAEAQAEAQAKENRLLVVKKEQKVEEKEEGCDNW
jgi:hypothetical protein